MIKNETPTNLLNELLYENDKVRCYENVFTRTATKDCQKDYKGRERRF
jgi:hypothetical protein